MTYNVITMIEIFVTERARDTDGNEIKTNFNVLLNITNFFRNFFYIVL